MTFVLKVNGEDVADLGLGVQSIGGWLSQPTTGRSVTQAPGWLTGASPSAVVTLEPRTVPIRLVTKGLTFATRGNLADQLQDRWQGRLELEFGDQPDRVLMAYLEAKPVELEFDQSWYDPEPNVTLDCEFTAYQPLFRDKTAHIVAFDSTARSVPMGTGPHRGIMRIGGSASDPVVTIKDFRGVTVYTMTFSGTLAADEAWIVDLYDHTIILSDSGVETGVTDGSVLDQGVAGNGFVEFLPEWASREAATWPTIAIDSGSADLTYFRGWRT